MVTLQIVSYNEIEDLTSVGRIRKLLNIAKENKIALLQGRLKKEEEAFYMPYIIASMILNNRFQYLARILETLKKRNIKRTI